MILEAKAVGEADRIYSILTRDLGLVRARALGVRKENSKLRGPLEPIVISSVSLVRGKDFWRITSAESIKKISAKHNVLKPLALLEKLVQGEESNSELFDSVEKYIITPELTHELFEIKLVAQILFHLGYLKQHDLSLGKQDLIEVINQGIKASHL